MLNELQIGYDNKGGWFLGEPRSLQDWKDIIKITVGYDVIILEDESLDTKDNGVTGGLFETFD